MSVSGDVASVVEKTRTTKPRHMYLEFINVEARFSAFLMYVLLVSNLNISPPHVCPPPCRHPPNQVRVVYLAQILLPSFRPCLPASFACCVSSTTDSPEDAIKAGRADECQF